MRLNIEDQSTRKLRRFAIKETRAIWKLESWMLTHGRFYPGYKDRAEWKAGHEHNAKFAWAELKKREWYVPNAN